MNQPCATFGAKANETASPMTSAALFQIVIVLQRSNQSRDQIFEHAYTPVLLVKWYTNPSFHRKFSINLPTYPLQQYRHILRYNFTI